MTNVINPDFAVILSAKGNHFHLFDDCRGVMLGWTTHDAQGNDVFTTYRPTGTSAMTYAEACNSGLFGCKVCHRMAGAEVPAVCDRLKVRAARKAARELAKAATVEVEVPVVEAPKAAETISIEDNLSAIESQLEKLIADLEAMLAATALVGA